MDIVQCACDKIKFVFVMIFELVPYLEKIYFKTKKMSNFRYIFLNIFSFNFAMLLQSIIEFLHYNFD